MLSALGCHERRQRLWKALNADCDALIVHDPQHLTYFANYHQSAFVFRGNDAGAFLILEPDRATLVADNIAQPFADQAFVDEVIAPVWYNGKKSADRRQVVLVANAFEALKKTGARRIGLERSSVPASLVEAIRSWKPAVEWVDLDPLIRPLRRNKDADELILMRESLRLCSAAMRALKTTVEPGMTEVDAYRTILNAVNESAGQPTWIYGDFVSGERCERGGGPPSDRRIAKGDLFLLDLSVIVHGYRGDVANTIPVGDRPTSLQIDRAAACLEAITAGEAMLRSGGACRDVDAALRRVVPRNYTSHGGHGLGLGHPEPPYIVPESHESLEVGDIVALEPGQYIPGVCGMRFERNYRITASGFETLSSHELGLS